METATKKRWTPPKGYSERKVPATTGQMNVLHRMLMQVGGLRHSPVSVDRDIYAEWGEEGIRKAEKRISDLYSDKLKAIEAIDVFFNRSTGTLVRYLNGGDIWPCRREDGHKYCKCMKCEP